MTKIEPPRIRPHGAHRNVRRNHERLALRPDFSAAIRASLRGKANNLDWRHRPRLPPVCRPAAKKYLPGRRGTQAVAPPLL